MTLSLLVDLHWILRNDKQVKGEKWVYSSLEEVTAAIESVGYDNSKVHYVKGKGRRYYTKNVYLDPDS